MKLIVQILFILIILNINGNTRTQDYVIRRELDISEGDAFLLNDTNVIRKQINSLGFFENVEVKQKKS